MNMPPEKVGVLVITAVIAILVSVTLLNSEERTVPDRDATWEGDGFENLESVADDFRVDDLRAGEHRTRVQKPYKKRLEKKEADRPRPSILRHQVQKGETLGSIARKHYGKSSMWQVVARANPGLDPKKMRAGIVIQIPSLAGRRIVAPPAGRPSERSTGLSGGEWYRVARGDSLERIARKKLGRGSAWPEI
ncbi:MAG: LysM peptidoglycan-binding domain-containing protein, partial [Planctomycetes bacterium]|nr:LysM peptidoglycan-binding domain-containing protein [Planctomycetota bacterium]